MYKMKKTILIYNPQDSTSAPRVHKQIDALKDEYDIVLATRKYAKSSNGQFKLVILPDAHYKYKFHLGLPTILRKSFSLLFKITQSLQSLFKQNKSSWSNQNYSDYRIIAQHDFSLIITHHAESLSVSNAIKKAKEVPLIMNAHEFYPGQFTLDINNPDTRNNTYLLCKKHLPEVDHMFSVGDLIGKKYQKEFRLREYSVVPNNKPFEELKPRKCTYPIKLVHHGVAVRRRELHSLIQVAAALDPEKYELHFMLVPLDNDYYIELVNQGSRFDNIQFHDPVSFTSIPSFINQFDAGLYILPANSINNELALPNKLFEFIQARLAVFTSPNPEMKNVIETQAVGRTADNYSITAMISLLKNINPEHVNAFKINTVKAAKMTSSETTEALIRRIIGDIIPL